MSYYRHLIQTAIPDPLLTSQVALYKFDANANDFIGTQNGTSNNISYANNGKIDKCATFSGATNSFISVPHSSNFNFGTGSFSMNFWIFMPASVPDGYIFAKRGAGLEFQMTTVSRKPELRLYSQSTGTINIGAITNSALASSTWTMITFTFSGGLLQSGFKAYVNGSLNFSVVGQSPSLFLGMATTTSNLAFGRRPDLAVAPFNGRLDQFRIWKGRELTATEITEIYNTLY